MLRAIGIRVAPKIIHFTIVEKVEGQLGYKSNKLIIPRSLEVPETLAYIRTSLFSVIHEFKIEKAGIRTAETIAQNVNIIRIQLEGVIQELLASCNISEYYLANISRLSNLLGEDITTIKGFIDGDNNFLNVESTPKSHVEIRESILTAFAALEI